jgi:hypothetical protein
MTRFRATSTFANPHTGKALTLKTRAELGVNLLAKVVGNDLACAGELLKKTQARLHSTALFSDALLHHFAGTYFLVHEQPIAAKDAALISAVVTKVLNGLASDVTLKVGTNVGRGDQDVVGQVRRLPGARGRKPYHAEVSSLDDNKPYRTGAMHIAQDVFGGPQGVRALIHEASHKYAGTIDYCYFDDTGDRPLGVFKERSRALINADSYAWFVMMAGATAQG